MLAQVQQKGADTAAAGKAEFDIVVRGLDEADQRLRATLERLRTTIVEVVLRPEGEEKRTLLDFVDEGGVEGLVGVVRRVVEQAGEGIKEFHEKTSGFEEEVRAVRRTLDGGRETPRCVKIEVKSSLPNILHEMEDHAKEMAESLESLVKHFDLCVTAIKHTEGGGDAALRVAGELPEGVDIEQTPANPMDKNQWEDMVRVLKQDASQVEDVVMEIQGHHAEMEALYERVEAHSDGLAIEHSNTTKAFTKLEEIGRKLPGYITQSQVFLLHWDEEKEKIEERLQELESGREVYDGFLRAYDKLLVEVGRRKAAELEMDKVVQSARARLEKLYEDEAEDRAGFKEEHGYFLPSDLWAGFEARPLQFEVLPVNDRAARIPHISASVIRRAIQRVQDER